jgi:hypothetical protein
LIRYQVQTGKGNSAWVWSAGLDSIQSWTAVPSGTPSH